MFDELLVARPPANTVAFNADPAVEALSRVAYRGEDLREAYAHFRNPLDQASTS